MSIIRRRRSLARAISRLRNRIEKKHLLPGSKKDTKLRAKLVRLEELQAKRAVQASSSLYVPSPPGLGVVFQT